MKTMLSYPLAVAALTAGLGFNALAVPSTGRVDFGKFTPPGDGGQFVQVQIKSNLLSLAAQLIEKQQPDVANLLRSVQLIQVNVIGLTDENRAEVTNRVRQIRQELAPQGWEQTVMVQDKNGQDVGVYIKTRGEQALAGLVVTVIEPKGQAVLVNIVGDIRPEQVAVLGEKLNLKPLKDVGAALKEAAPEK
jgi:hypothetical protein